MFRTLNSPVISPFMDLHLSVSNGFVSSKIYDKRDDFDFDIVNFPFLDGDVPCRPYYGVYISQLVLGMGYVILLWHSLSLPCGFYKIC